MYIGCSAALSCVCAVTPASSGVSVSSTIHHSRYDLGEEHAREKERYAAKEREEVIRRSKERKLAETKVRGTERISPHPLLYIILPLHT